MAKTIILRVLEKNESESYGDTNGENDVYIDGWIWVYYTSWSSMCLDTKVVTSSPVDNVAPLAIPIMQEMNTSRN